jgi:hypothetical protein
MMIFFLNFGPIMAIEKSQNALDFSTFNFFNISFWVLEKLHQSLSGYQGGS